jgi:hypothetical protein
VSFLTLSSVALGLAALPALLYRRNTRLFRPPPAASDIVVSPPQVSVLIPARNEETSIAACVESVLASVGVEIEVIVLDDHSEDRTAEVVREIARKDPRVRLEIAPPLPPNWCGKQHACFVLSKHARFSILTFLDADVRLAADALARMAAFLAASNAELVSGFPHQQTGTFLEKLLIPLINWLLLCYLPMRPMRKYRFPALGAGCGQWFMTRRDAYDRVGGHEAVKASLHDGVTLPRAFRTAGFRTDICDATDLAECRMYRSAGQVWNGLAKNAREGLGAPVLIWVWTILLFGGHILPFVLLGCVGMMSATEAVITATAAGLACLPRLDAARRFRQSCLGTALHPIGILLLLVIQWYAAFRALIGKPVGWKGRVIIK